MLGAAKVFESVEDLSSPSPRPTLQPDHQWTDCSSYTRNPSDPIVYLTETFYITSKKNTIFQVRLTSQGLVLRKECNGTAKEQKVLLRDIIGCRCLRSKKKARRNGKATSSSCSCSLPGSAQQLKVVEADSGEQDEQDSSAYLYIYAYIPKKGISSTTTSSIVNGDDNNNRSSHDKGHNKSTTAITKAHNNNAETADNGRRDRTTITLRFRSFDKYEDNHQEAQKWRLAVKNLINREVPEKILQSPTKMSLVYTPRDNRKTLVILNPKSGSGKARESFQQRVAPMMTEAEVPYDLYVTKYPNFAREFMRTRDVFSWKNIVVVGGDGIYFEVLNGLCERPDWERALDEIAIGVIPCGSGNGLAKTIAHLNRVRFSIVEATLAVVRGRSAPMDVVRLETKGQIMFSFLSVGWGLMADIDIESERLRALGGQRFTIWAVHRLISLRTYRGRLSYLPATHLIARETSPSVYERKGSVNGESEKRRSSLKHSKSCTAALSSSVMDGGDFKDSGEEDGGVCDACDMMDFGEVLSLETSISGGGGGGGVNGRSRMDSFYSVGSKRSSYFSMTDSVYQDVHDGEENGAFGASGTNGVPNKVRMYGPSSNIPALTEPVPSSWTVMEGEFVMVHTAHLTHLGSDCYFAKQSQLNDGVIWMVVIKGGIPRTQLLSFLLGLSSGTHVPEGHSDYVKMIPCTAFRIEPEGNQGHLTVDGERVELGAIQGEVFDGMVNVTVPDVGE